MPFFKRDTVSIYYEEHGEGFPVLLIAPGGMRSAISAWERSPFNPITELSPYFRVIAMDQRNAGHSTAQVTTADNWATYTTDHVALLDELKVDRTHVLGQCIGGPYCLRLMQAIPDRVASGVLEQPIGLDGNRDMFYELFDSWRAEIEADHPEADEAAWRSFRENMFGGDFGFSMGRDSVAACETPMLVLMGNDDYHPESTSREVAKLAKNATLIESWKSPKEDGTVAKVLEFLRTHTPKVVGRTT